MSDEIVTIPIKNWKEPHIMLMCIYTPWASNKPRLPKVEFEIQQKWIKEFLRLRDDNNIIEFSLSRNELRVLIIMIEKGLSEYLSAEDFGTIVGVGEDPQIAIDLIEKLKKTLI